MISSPNHILEMDHLATLFCLQEGEHHLCRITQAALLCTYNKTNAWTISTGLLLMSTVLVRRWVTTVNYVLSPENNLGVL